MAGIRYISAALVLSTFSYYFVEQIVRLIGQLCFCRHQTSSMLISQQGPDSATVQIQEISDLGRKELQMICMTSYR